MERVKRTGNTRFRCSAADDIYIVAVSADDNVVVKVSSFYYLFILRVKSTRRRKRGLKVSTKPTVCESSGVFFCSLSVNIDDADDDDDDD